MTRSELVSALTARQPHLLPRDVEMAVNCILEQMSVAILRDERIEIRGFGAFSMHHIAPRIGRNPKTGVAVSLSAKRTIHFKPGKEIRDRVEASRAHCKIRTL
ncbi:MAG: integration host factor subunit beta [Methylococcales bacterium]|nr:integration host factor subunit beta [Methylococcales bacterium]